MADSGCPAVSAGALRSHLEDLHIYSVKECPYKRENKAILNIRAVAPVHCTTITRTAASTSAAGAIGTAPRAGDNDYC